MARLLRPFHRHSKDDASSPRRGKSSTQARASTTSSTGSSTNSTSSSWSTSSSGGRRSSQGARGGARGFTLKSDGDGVPHTVLMPPAFFRQLRALAEQTAALVDGGQQRGSTKASGPPSSSSRGSRWRGDLSTKALDRLALLLTEDEADGFTNTLGRRSEKPIALETAAKAMLQLWECCMRILDVLADSSAPEQMRHTVAHSRDIASASLMEKRRQLEQAALTVLALVVRRQEIDALLVALGNGGCKSHKPTEELKRGVGRLSRRALSRNSRRLRSISTNSNSNRPSAAVHPTRRSSKKNLQKKDKRSSDRSLRLCDVLQQYLELHQATLQFAYDTVHGPVDANNSSTAYDAFNPHQELLSALVATSYVRVPRLRNHILDNLTNLQPPNALSSSRSLSLSLSSFGERGRGKSVYEDRLRLTPFKWHHNMYPQCQNCLTTVNREDRWAPSAVLLDHLMADTDGCTLVLAQVLEQLTGQQVAGRTDWKCIPGSDVLLAATLTITKKVFQNELRQREPTWQDDAEERRVDSGSTSSKQPQPFRESFSLLEGAVEETNSPCAFFAVQVTTMMHENMGLIHDYMMTVLQATNYMLPHHVVLCLQYLEQLLLQFPAFFVNEPAAQNFLALSTMTTANPHSQPLLEHTCADAEMLRYVFSCLLDSEHFEILKATELFLLKHFGRFSVTLQLQLTDLFAMHVKRLFLHWNRDVRYCYYHILLYLTYPGNRLVLGARSDEALMGAEASQLFEIPGLVRSASVANWDAFDVPLQQLVTRFTHVTKRRQRTRLPASWADAVSWSILQRAVVEYKTHVQTYFAYARQLSLHQRVPTPVFSVKSGETAASTAAVSAPPLRAAVLA
ncbi:hypothetical protein BBJ28_00010195 [Nothophytophthora sp. Chile5]|nr:hypothetical protein BBJ28_00010195 [Nothophytophthora sp. Chile5]